MAVTKGQNWIALVNGSDPEGNAAAAAGSDRMHMLTRVSEFNGLITISTMTIGGQTFTYNNQEWLDNGSQDLQIDAWIWDEAAIAARSGSAISFTDDKTASKQSWSHVQFDGVDQAVEPTYASESNVSASSFNLTTTSNSSDMIAALYIVYASSRAPMGWDTLSEIDAYSISDYATGIADGAGGDATTTLTTDEVAATGFAAMAIIFTAAGGSLPSYHAANRGIMRGVARGIG